MNEQTTNGSSVKPVAPVTNSAGRDSPPRSPNTPARLISAEEISERLDEVADALGPEGWEKFRRSPAGKPMMDLIHDCQAHIEAIERQRANPAARMAAALICPPAADEPARLRAKGAL